MSNESKTEPDVTRAVSAILEDMAEITAAAQTALLKGELEILQHSLKLQLALSQELEARLRDEPSPTESQEIINAALRARSDNRVFMAILRKLRRNLEVLRNARRAPAMVYGLPSSAGKADV
jgi:hypothetical protein